MRSNIIALALAAAMTASSVTGGTIHDGVSTGSAITKEVGTVVDRTKEATEKSAKLAECRENTDCIEGEVVGYPDKVASGGTVSTGDTNSGSTSSTAGSAKAPTPSLAVFKNKALMKVGEISAIDSKSIPDLAKGVTRVTTGDDAVIWYQKYSKSVKVYAMAEGETYLKIYTKNKKIHKVYLSVEEDSTVKAYKNEKIKSGQLASKINLGKITYGGVNFVKSVNSKTKAVKFYFNAAGIKVNEKPSAVKHLKVTLYDEKGKAVTSVTFPACGKASPISQDKRKISFSKTAKSLKLSNKKAATVSYAKLTKVNPKTDFFDFWIAEEKISQFK